VASLNAKSHRNYLATCNAIEQLEGYAMWSPEWGAHDQWREFNAIPNGGTAR